MKHVYEVYHIYTKKNLIFSTKKEAEKEIKNWNTSVITEDSDNYCMLGIAKRILH